MMKDKGLFKKGIAMYHKNITIKRLILYIFGLFFLSLGVSLSIEADLGVSPVSSLAYAFALTSGFSVGAMTVVANVLFIIVQVFLSKRFNLKESIVQLIIAFLFGFFIDITIKIVQVLPTPESMIMRWGFLILSLFVVAIGLLGYMTAKLPLMPYDELTYVISEKFNMQFGKAKISSDLINVCIAGFICIMFIQSFGSIGIGTLVAAYFIGKILGWFIKRYQQFLLQWMNNEKAEPEKEIVPEKQTSAFTEKTPIQK